MGQNFSACFYDIKARLNTVSSMIDNVQNQVNSNDRFLSYVSHRTFNKIFNPIRSVLQYHIITPPIHRTPDDCCQTIVFYHTSWPDMPIAQITKSNGVKEYYINTNYCNVLNAMMAKEKV